MNFSLSESFVKRAASKKGKMKYNCKTEKKKSDHEIKDKKRDELYSLFLTKKKINKKIYE